MKYVCTGLYGRLTSYQLNLGSHVKYNDLNSMIYFAEGFCESSRTPIHILNFQTKEIYIRIRRK